MGLRNQVSGGGDGMLQAVTYFYVVPGSYLVNLSPYDTCYFAFAHNYALFCERHYELADYMKKTRNCK